MSLTTCFFNLKYKYLIRNSKRGNRKFLLKLINSHLESLFKDHVIGSLLIIKLAIKALLSLREILSKIPFYYL
jgi:hypothetical protein